MTVKTILTSTHIICHLSPGNQSAVEAAVQGNEAYDETKIILSPAAPGGFSAAIPTSPCPPPPEVEGEPHRECPSLPLAH